MAIKGISILSAPVACVALALLASASPSVALDVLWQSPAGGYTTVGSYSWLAPPANQEAADDFEAVGSIERIVMSGYNNCLGPCPPGVQVLGASVRVYAWTTHGPGALQLDDHFTAGDPGFVHDTTGPDAVDITLHVPFAAMGKHFLSVQLEFQDAFGWYVWSANHNAPQLSKLWVRNDGGPWLPYSDILGTLNDDLAFTIYGCPPGGCAPVAPFAGCGQWEEVASSGPANALESRLNDVTVLAPYDAWAVGKYTAYGPVPGDQDDSSLAMRWNGTAWSVVPTPSPGPGNGTTSVEFTAVSAADPTHVFAVGRQSGQDPWGYLGPRVFAAAWDGLQWNDLGAPWPNSVYAYQGASGEQLYDVVAIAPDDVWMVGRWWHALLPSGAIEWPGVALHWNGSSFTIHELPWISSAKNQWATAVAATSSTDVWVVGQGNGTAVKAYVWHWDGSSWAAIQAPTPGAAREYQSVVALASDDVWVGGWYRDAQYNYFPMLIHWNGSLWEQVSAPAGGSELAAWSATNITTYGVNGWAHFDGASWTAQSGPPIIPYGAIIGLESVSPCELWAIGMKDVGGDYAALTVRLHPVGSADTDGDGLEDATDNCPAVFNPDQSDCDGDGAGDACELAGGTQHDCNGTGVPDECETFVDCDSNGVPDACQADCNANGHADVCDILGGSSQDCNGTGAPDECETFADCNTNGIDDACDIAGGPSADSNTNGYPDECEALGPDDVTVTTISDVVDFGAGQTRNDLPGPDGRVSFREALLAARNTPGHERIAFNIPPEDWWTLDDQRALLEQVQGIFFVEDDGLTLDFTTQTAFTGDTNPAGGEVAIYGLEPNAWGVASILIDADGCTVKGLGDVYQRGYGVEIRGNGNRVVGSTIDGPLYAGVRITDKWDGSLTQGNVVGGTAPGEGNRLVGGNDGLLIAGNTTGNLVVGNLLLSGPFHGVHIGGAAGNRIGGPTMAERNLISGSGHYGEEGCPTGGQIELDLAHGTLVEGNYIGTTAEGSAAYPGQRATVGVSVMDSDGVVLRGNLVSGIRVLGLNHCDGELYGTAILIGGDSTGTVVEGNRIGTDAGGGLPVANVEGVRLAYGFNSQATPLHPVVGGLADGAGNVIAFNELDGVVLDPVVATVTISRNSIHDNGALGIDLSGTGNDGQPAPVITAAETDGLQVRLQGTLQAAPGRAQRLEFFASAPCDPSGAGEGERWLGDVIVVTDTSGQAAFDTLLLATAAAGEFATATATDQVGANTSAFSGCEPLAQVSCAGPLPPVHGLTLSGDRATLLWASLGAMVSYDVARGTLAQLQSGAGLCIATGVGEAAYQDTEIPAAGATLYYLVRAAGGCQPGAWSDTGIFVDCP